MTDIKKRIKKEAVGKSDWLKNAKYRRVERSWERMKFSCLEQLRRSKIKNDKKQE